ncbi:hypothetical protein SKAU_G00157140 [Synaphobranchus kaupii]|uniref:Ig-like domain-containing protein n=1 Tax=Synaphobranchus kaupii TaxID=118154 RepID=A0A9Q1IX92_SYNKA|nr:hypothetical protein SKAU_G00157140 [Synaphobranchus kaupii]
MEETQVMQLIVIVLQCSTYRGSLGNFHSEHCLTGDDVVLNCNGNAEGKWQEKIDVEWKRVDPSGHEVTVFNSNEPEKRRIGATVDGLEQGDPSLLLANVNLADEGVYICTVIVTPSEHEGRVRLDVSVRPNMELPGELTVTEGEEKTLLCKISRFYPRQIYVFWLIGSSSGREMAPISRGVCTTETEDDGNRTFSVSSRITVTANATVNNGAKYVCMIKHRAYPEHHNRSVILRIKGPYDITPVIAGTMVTSTILVLLVVGSIFIYCRYFQKVSPSVSVIIKPSLLFAKVPTELKCNITNYRPRDMKVSWLKLSPELDGDTAVTRKSFSEACPLNGWLDLSDKAVLDTDNMYFTSTLCIQLAICEDNTKYQCIVCYGDKSITRETTVNVKAHPSVLQISSLPHIPEVGKLLVLCCHVEKFYPKDIHLEWSRQGQAVGNVTQFGPFPDTDNKYSIWGKTELMVAKEDNNTMFTCRVYHNSFHEPGYEDVTYQINTDGIPPSVMFINCDPPQPKAGEKCTLSLYLGNFCPEQVSVTWYRNSQQVHTGVFLSPPALNINGLYSLWSFLQLTPTGEDHSSVFRCLVEHSAQAEPEKREYTFNLHS